MADKKNSKAQRLYAKTISKIASVLQTNEASTILNDLSSGKNSYMKMNRTRTSAFDDEWIDKIEDVIFDLGDIIANPRMTTKVVTDVIPVELAKKTNAESVRHLASHTQYIKDVDERGNVIPNKVLNISYEDDTLTYENRFIATFVRKLLLFVEKRYEYIVSLAPIYNEEVLYVKNLSIVDGKEVEIETKIKVKAETSQNNPEKLKSFLDRILQIREYILYFYGSPFMKKFKTEKNVRNPILQTNIIRKNLKYHHCYEVYKFIESYDKMGVDSKVDEEYLLFSDEELQDINKMMFVNYLACQSTQEAAHRRVNSKTYKPKLLTSLDDESFVYGPLLSGPVSFIRTDEQFREYYSNRIRGDLPIHPTKREREYYREEFSIKKEIKEELTQLDYLQKRVKRDTERFNKIVDQVIKDREEEARLLALQEEENRRAAEEEELNRVRDAVVERARKDFPVRSDIDEIVDAIINEGYDPNDVTFMEVLENTVAEKVAVEEAENEANENPEPSEESSETMVSEIPSENPEKPSETVVEPVSEEQLASEAEVNEEAKSDELPVEYEADDYADTPVEELPNAPTELEETPVEDLPNAPTAEASESATEETKPEPKVEVDLYDEDDGTGIWYVVRQFQGFYVSDTEVTRKPEKAKVFKAESAVRRFKKTHFGRVKLYSKLKIKKD